jgi:diguanylate cyclase (GGDEF)-like protein
MLLRGAVARSLARARRSGSLAALLMVDLDGFKSVNDHHGHAAGDRVLVAIARRFQGCVRQSDLVARIGGDEFVVVLEDLKGYDAMVPILDKLLSAAGEIVEARPGLYVRVNASIGVAFYPEDGVELDDLLSCADQAMYAAKAAGRGCWRAHSAKYK